jgi:hypothetical protein
MKQLLQLCITAALLPVLFVTASNMTFAGSVTGLDALSGKLLSIQGATVNATALGTSPATCTAGQYARGISTTGSAVGCTAAAGGGDMLAANNLSEVSSAVALATLGGLSINGNASQVTGLLASQVTATTNRNWLTDAQSSVLSTIGTAAASAVADFDIAGLASAAQAFAIQRANHTGTQPASSVDGTALVAAAIGTTVQAYDADLTTWAEVTPGTGVTAGLANAATGSGAPVLGTSPTLTTPYATWAEWSIVSSITIPIASMASSMLNNYGQPVSAVDVTFPLAASCVGCNAMYSPASGVAATMRLKPQSVDYFYFDSSAASNVGIVSASPQTVGDAVSFAVIKVYKSGVAGWGWLVRTVRGTPWTQGN